MNEWQRIQRYRNSMHLDPVAMDGPDRWSVHTHNERVYLTFEKGYYPRDVARNDIHQTEMILAECIRDIRRMEEQDSKEPLMIERLKDQKVRAKEMQTKMDALKGDIDAFEETVWVFDKELTTREVFSQTKAAA